MHLRYVVAALALAATIPLAAPAAAQAPGMVPGAHHLHLKGIGKVRFGMSVREARDAAGVHMVRSRVNECTYLSAGPPGTGQGPTLMLVGGKLRVVSTSRPRRAFSTPKGVGVGTRLRRVRRLYPGGDAPSTSARRKASTSCGSRAASTASCSRSGAAGCTASRAA